MKCFRESYAKNFKKKKAKEPSVSKWENVFLEKKCAGIILYMKLSKYDPSLLYHMTPFCWYMQ